MKALLFVTEKFPWPLDDGGQIRTYQILRSVALKFPVILIATAPSCPQDKEPIERLGVEVITVRRHRTRFLSPWYLVVSLFTKRPYPLPKNFSRQILKTIRQQVRAGRVQAIHLNHLDAAQYIDWLDEFRSEVKVVFDSHNLLTPLYGRLLKVERNLLRKAFIWVQLRKMQAYERATIQKIDCVAVCSTVERDILAKWGVTQSLVLRNGVDTQYYTPAGRLRVDGQPLAMVFTGALDYFPNADGIRWFLRCVSPKLKQLGIDSTLTVVGKNPPNDLLSCQAAGGIKFTGRVADVRPYTRSADLFVVPLQIGGGTRLKILEALAMKIPVISTGVGAEGLDLNDGVHLRIVDDAAEMAETIAELSAFPDRMQELAYRGYEYVINHYDWSAVTAPIFGAYANG